MRTLIAGIPRSGKSTFSNSPAFAGTKVLHTDDLIAQLAWSDASQAAAEWMSFEGSWAIEGVAVPRALRKWLAANPEGKPADIVYWLDTPRVELTPGQATMAKGCRTIWAEVLPELEARGVEIRTELP